MTWPKKIVEIMKNRKLVPILKAETPETRTALSGKELLVPVLPFRVGRENRHLRAIATTYQTPRDRRDPKNRPSNDLFLPEAGGKIYISRQHFLIHLDDQGRYYVLDRGSTLGTIVAGRKIGGAKKWGKAFLASGDLIIPGGKKSPFQFRFELRPARTLQLPAIVDSPEIRTATAIATEADAG
jgi:pSer/pThr/pTyr-binding forkhead associated (FHA) protein